MGGRHSGVKATRRLPPGNAVSRTTRFSDPSAVDLWDACFRWRSGGQLRDRTIDATWQRVAGALTRSTGEERAYWHSRYAFAFGKWQILPDVRLLRYAGTDMPVPPMHDPVAVVNAGVFVSDPHTSSARFDHQRFGAAAAVAVRMLDDAVLEFGPTDALPMRLGVGMVGLGDALDALGLVYGSGRSPAVAQAIAQSLAMGCLQGSLILADERGRSRDDGGYALSALWRHRALSGPMAEAMSRNHRHACLTRIGRQPELACLANGASDALEPHEGARISHGGMRALSADAARRIIHNAVLPWVDSLLDPAPPCATSQAEA